MTDAKDTGVPAQARSGSRASHEAAAASSPEASIPNAKELDRDESSFLLYVETRAVDHGSILDGRQMNEEDHAAARKFVRLRWMDFGRVPSDLLRTTDAQRLNATHYAELTDAGWAVAHELRRLRALRRGPFATRVFAHELVHRRTASALADAQGNSHD